MADWTLILTTVGAAGVTGGFGYLAAKQGARASMRQAEQQHQTALAQVEAENERLREQHREDHLRNRQGTYHSFMTADRRLFSLLDRMSEMLGRDSLLADVMEKYDEWHHLAMGVELFGSNEARDAIKSLMQAYGDAIESAHRRAAETGEDEDALLAAYLGENATTLDNARMVLIAAMRADVARDI
jgi:hypothetical protein